MEDDAEGMPRPGENFTISMPHACPVCPFDTMDGSMVDWKYAVVSMIYGNDLETRLHSWSLLSQNKFTAGKILPWYGKQEGDMAWKGKRTIKVAVQSILVSGLYFSRGGVGRICPA